MRKGNENTDIIGWKSLVFAVGNVVNVYLSELTYTSQDMPE